MPAGMSQGGLPETFRVATFNVNGIRAAMRRGMGDWLACQELSVLCLQEVRAPDAVLREAMGDGWFVAHHESTIAGAKGRAGVAICSTVEPLHIRNCVGNPEWLGHGRWVEADFALAAGEPLTVVSAYIHSGEADTPKQEAKYAFLDDVTDRLGKLVAQGRQVLLTGDINVGHTENDIKNWKGNVKRAGFLPAEREYLTRWADEIGLVDVVRVRHGDAPGPYSWWSFRGKAFDNDAGWRIDYHWATPGLAALASADRVHREDCYDARVSDHAAVEVTYGT